MSKSYLGEIFEQPGIIERIPQNFSAELIAELTGVRSQIERGEIDRVILTGMGGSLHGVYALWMLLSKTTNVPAAIWDSSELVQQAPRVITEKSAVIAVSQSGESVELVKIAELSRRPKVAISVTNSDENKLARWADISILTLAGPENTASTKSYTAGLATLHILGQILVEGDAADASAQLVATAEKVDAYLQCWKSSIEGVVDFLGANNAITFIGRGYSVASALMSALLTQEASKLPCMAHSGGQFRHGPLELVREGFSSILFPGGPATVEINKKTARAISSLGGKCLWIAPNGAPVDLDDNTRLLTVPDVDEALLPVLEILPIQVLQIPLAIARNFEPAAFLNA